MRYATFTTLPRYPAIAAGKNNTGFMPRTVESSDVGTVNARPSTPAALVIRIRDGYGSVAPNMPDTIWYSTGLIVLILVGGVRPMVVPDGRWVVDPSGSVLAPV